MFDDKKEPLQERWKQPCAAEDNLFEAALGQCCKRVRLNLKILGDRTAYDIAPGGRYEPVENTSWTSGFWPGMIWLAYLRTGDNTLLAAGKQQSASFRNRLDTKHNIQMHDLGFLYCLSTGADFAVTGDEEAKETTIRAAYALVEMYRPRAGILQRDGDLRDLSHRCTGQFIVDCMNNVPLLFRAAQLTGDRVLYEIAERHMQNSIEILIRPGGAVCQTGVADVETGVLHPDFFKCQGRGGPESAWSRGQAWAIAGLPITFEYTGEAVYLEKARCATNYFLNRMPGDLVANWDLYFTDDDCQRDTSASAIACCGLFQMAELLPEGDSDKELYKNAAVRILKSLTDRYLIEDSDNMGLLRAGTYGYTMEKGIDMPSIFGDYYYMEALFRALGLPIRFW